MKETIPPDYIHQWIREKRAVENMTVAQLADMVGITRQYMYLIEAGKQLPKMSVLQRIAKAFNGKFEFEFKEKDNG